MAIKAAVFWTPKAQRRTFPRAMAEPFGPGARLRPYAIAVGALVVVIAVVTFVVRAGDARREAPVEPEITKVEIFSLPVGAFVVRADDGGLLGQTPMTLTTAKSDKDFPVIVKADGYQDRPVKVPLFSETGRVDVRLNAIGADAAASPPPPPDGWVP